MLRTNIIFAKYSQVYADYEKTILISKEFRNIVARRILVSRINLQTLIKYDNACERIWYNINLQFNKNVNTVIGQSSP